LLIYEILIISSDYLKVFVSDKIREIRFSNLWGGPLNENSGHIFAAQHALNIYKSNSIYSFIPKCACSTMRLSLALSNGLISDVKKYNWIHSNNTTFSASLGELICAKFTFVILRNPFLRLASTYLDKIINSANDTAKVKENLLKKNPDVKPDELTFNKFVKLISEKDILNLDNHWRPQVDFLVYNNYDLYAQLEKFEDYKNLIEKKCDIKIIDARKLTLHGNDIFEKIEDKNFSNVKPSEILNLRKKGMSPSLISMYDKVSIKIILDSFKNDIILYDKCFNEKCSEFKIID
tara:strand:- start:150 stop:1025 length:876 start_codon:yes stop_codon:yes gene_type:complete